MVRFSPSIEQRKHFIIVKLTIWVWCGVAIMNEPNLDKELEELVQTCPECQAKRRRPETAPLHPWNWPTRA